MFITINAINVFNNSFINSIPIIECLQSLSLPQCYEHPLLSSTVIFILTTVLILLTACLTYQSLCTKLSSFIPIPSLLSYSFVYFCLYFLQAKP